MNPRLAAGWLLALALGATALHLLTRKVEAPQAVFATIDGATLTTRALHGRVVLVNFWATSCAVCVQEMPQLVDTHRRYAARGLETIAVAMSWDPPNRVVEFANARALPFRVAFDPVGDVARAFEDTRLTPMLFVIDRQGRIVQRFRGAPDFPGLHALIERLLAEAAPARVGSHRAMPHS
jgi:peroxiredoxin